MRQTLIGAAIPVVLVGAAAAWLAFKPEPLAELAAREQVCVAVAPGRSAVVGLGVLHNRGDREVEIEKVALLGPADVGPVEAFVVPIVEGKPIGTAIAPPSSPGWELRRPAVDALIRPSTGGTEQLVIVLKPASSRPVSVDGVEVRYRDGVLTYQVESTQRVDIKVAPDRCS